MPLVIIRRHHAVVLAVERNKYLTDDCHGFDGHRFSQNASHLSVVGKDFLHARRLVGAANSGITSLRSADSVTCNYKLAPISYF
jgi:hypothetical protein